MPVDSANQLTAAHKALQILTKDFDELPAYKKGYIDKKGKRTIPHWSELNQKDYVKNYDIFTRLMIMIKQVMSKLPAEEKRKFKYPLLLKALREELSNEMTEIETVEYLLELKYLVKSDENLSEELNNLIFEDQTSYELHQEPYNRTMVSELEIEVESMVAGAGGHVAGVNDASENPSTDTIKPKKQKKSKKQKNDKLKKILDKL